MKIVMFSINPIYPYKVTGGASKHLYHIACYLGKDQHDVTILCPQTGGLPEEFFWADKVKVRPILPFHLPFPQPYAISPPDLAIIIEKLSESLRNADKFYIHDGEFLIPDVYENIPTIASFRDNLYPESILGTFTTKADDIICVSEYSASVIKNTAGRFIPDLKDRVHVVNNGIDFDMFTPRDSGQLAKELDVSPKNEVILLHPHRPEPGKGLAETIKVVEKLVRYHGVTNLRVLIPEWLDTMVSISDSDYSKSMEQLMRRMGVADHFLFFPWLPMSRMPELYSLGDVTLCLGNIVEAFGNVAYESLACGTPTLVARVGVHRTLMPDDLIAKVDFGDIDTAAERVLAIINGEKAPNKQVSAFLKNTMNFNLQMKNYSTIILNCQKRAHPTFSDLGEDSSQFYKLSPWCYITGGKIFHDYRGAFEEASELSELLNEFKVFSRQEVEQAGITQDKLRGWSDRAWIVPVL